METVLQRVDWGDDDGICAQNPFAAFNVCRGDGRIGVRTRKVAGEFNARA
jgi:hypothetical protein